MGQKQPILSCIANVGIANVVKSPFFTTATYVQDTNENPCKFSEF
jgi:hypothetical protein